MFRVGDLEFDDVYNSDPVFGTILFIMFTLFVGILIMVSF